MAKQLQQHEEINENEINYKSFDFANNEIILRGSNTDFRDFKTTWGELFVQFAKYINVDFDINNVTSYIESEIEEKINSEFRCYLDDSLLKRILSEFLICGLLEKPDGSTLIKLTSFGRKYLIEHS